MTSARLPEPPPTSVAPPCTCDQRGLAAHRAPNTGQGGSKQTRLQPQKETGVMSLVRWCH